MDDKAITLQVRLTQSVPIALDVQLQCGKGEMLALTGPSGSGKTTVLRCIAGLHRAANGMVKCNDQVWQDCQGKTFIGAQQRRVGLVFQQYALFPHLNVLQNVAIALSHVKGQDKKTKAMHWLSLTNMSGMHDKRPAQLSGGQRQRVALARALAREPDVLLLDEPFSAVDQLTREKLYRELALIRSNLNIPMILVTHDMLEVQQLADSLCLIHHGKTLQSGSINDVMRKPETARIARLLGHKNIYTANLNANKQLHVLGTRIDIHQQTALGTGPVSVLIEPSAIIMHRNDRPSNGERENPLSTQVNEMVAMGEDWLLKLDVLGTNEQISFRVSRHVAARNNIETNGKLKVSILSEGIHLMPAAQATSPLP